MQTKQNQLNRVGPRQAALIAGISLLLMALGELAFAAWLLVRGGRAEKTL